MTYRERLIEVFDYNCTTGRLERKTTSRGEKKVTDGVSKQGYYIRWVDKKCYTEHSLVWLYHHGKYAHEIDHVNRIKTDNRIENLRECDRSLNNGNHRLIRLNNKSGYRGVSWAAGYRKWWAQLSSKGVHYNLGYYDTPEDAAIAYDKAAVEHFGEFATLNGSSL